MERELIPSATPLLDVCRLLGISQSDLALVEDVNGIAHSFPVSSEHVAQLDSQTVRAFTVHYGDTARIEVRTDALTELVIGPGVTDQEIAELVRRAASLSSAHADVHVDKSLLAEKLKNDSSLRQIRVFFFADALIRLLGRGISWFEANVWTSAPEPLVIAVLDCEIQLEGEYLAVLGGNGLARTHDNAAAQPAGVDFARIIERRDQNVGWDSAWTRRLTPWHFQLSGKCDDPALHGLMRAQIIKLAILYTCDRARASQATTERHDILAEYRGRDHVAIIRIDERNGLDCTDAELVSVLRAVDWCYESHGQSGTPDWVADRLLFLQTRIAEFLEPQPSADRLQAFTRDMPYVLEGVEWHWKAFIEGKVGEFLDRSQQVEDVVNDTVAAFAGQAAGLTSSLTQNMLAAVAALIGSFIAAALASPFNASLFRAGLLSYAAYILLFPGITALTSTTTGLCNTRSAFDNRVQRFKLVLYPAKVDEVVGTRVEDASGSYRHWLLFVAIVYGIVVVATVIAAIAVPHLVHDVTIKGK
jgi:hypothetical protein